MKEARSEYTTSQRCPLCQCMVLTKKRKGLKTSLLKALSMADHVKTLHPSKLQGAR